MHFFQLQVLSEGLHEVDGIDLIQGGRSWQPFGEGKNGHKIIRQTRITTFPTNASFLRKFANSTQCNMQYIPCNSALLAQETLFFTPKKALF